MEVPRYHAMPCHANDVSHARKVEMLDSPSMLIVCVDVGHWGKHKLVMRCANDLCIVPALVMTDVVSA